MRAENYNRKYTKRNKVIRDRKKANIVGRRRLEGDKVIEIALTKKETKKQEKIAKIYKELNIKKNPADLPKRRHRQNKSGKYYIVKEGETEDIEMK